MDKVPRPSASLNKRQFHILLHLMGNTAPVSPATRPIPWWQQATSRMAIDADGSTPQN